MQEQENKTPHDIIKEDVDAFAARWHVQSLFADINYRVLFENKNEFANAFLIGDASELLDQYGTENKDWFIDYSFNERDEYGVEIYCKDLSWMVMTKLMDPEHEVLPKIMKIETRLR
jgi:hypothetical protein